MIKDFRKNITRLGVFLVTVFFFNCGYSQKTSIESSRNLVFYRGVDNPLTAIVVENNCKSFFLSTSNGEIRGANCEYIYRPDKIGTADIFFNSIIDGDTILIDTKSCRIRELPLPTARVAGLNKGGISKDLLLAQWGVNCSLENFELDLNVKVIGFRVIILRNNELVFTDFTNDNRFNNKIKGGFLLLKPGDILYILSIKAKFPSGHEIMTNSIELKIK